MTKTLFSLSAIILFTFFPLTALAQSAGIPFGGQIIAPPIPCTCPFTPGVQIIIKPALPAWPTHLVYLPGVSILYQYYQIFRPGPHLLGLVAPTPVPCLMVAPPPFFCRPPLAPYLPAGLPIIMTGTSL
ncbi:MAG: hypothetical protein WDZ85_03220 [Candidatus Paceibacterota bacterium]